jgi:hypothetical protein
MGRAGELSTVDYSSAHKNTLQVLKRTASPNTGHFGNTVKD